MKPSPGNMVLAILFAAHALPAQTTPVISLVANAEGETPIIAPNTWVEIKGAYLAPLEHTRIWQGSDFSSNQMPVKLDGVSVTVTPTPTPSPCVGDCHYNGTVTVDEILTMVNIALGNLQISDCLAGDANDDGQITVDEILTAVNNALNGCPKRAFYYVAPNGRDSWSGTLAAPNPALTDGPFATFDRARAVVQALNKTGLNQVVVQIRAGTYFLAATEQFTAADSGTASMPIVYQNYPGEAPVISGGVRLQNWIHIGGNTWKTTLPASTAYFEDLFYNGVRRLRPRLGGYLGTYYSVAAPVYLDAPAPPSPAPDPNCSNPDDYVSGKGWKCYDRFHYAASDPIAADWENLAAPSGNPCGQAPGDPALIGDVELIIWEVYQTSKLRISCIDPSNHTIYATGPVGQNIFQNRRYLIENVHAFTDPGQWFLDRSSTPWALFYLANPGENPNTDTVVIPQLPEVLLAYDIQYVTFQGLTFAHGNYTIPDEGLADSFMEPEINPAVSIQNAQHVVFDSGIVAQTSGVGLEFISCVGPSSPDRCISTSASAVTANNTIQNSAFYDTGASAIRIGVLYHPGDNEANSPQFQLVQNNVVEGYGRLIPAAFGISQGYGHDNTYTHNDVYDGYHGGISICGWPGVGGVPTGGGAANNVISFNHVYNLFQGIGNDEGAIHVNVGNPQFTAAGNKVFNNRVHDVNDASAWPGPIGYGGYGGDGIYVDWRSGFVDVENNLVYRVSGAPMAVSNIPPKPNQANTIKNNIFAFGRNAMVGRHKNEPNGPVEAPFQQQFVASNNIFYFDRSWDSSPPFSVQGGCTYSGNLPYSAYQDWNGNLYWRADGTFASDPNAFHLQPSPFTNDQPCSDDPSAWIFYTFSGWQNAGGDVNGVVQDPGFANPAYPADDFTLTRGSPLPGFVVFHPNQAGRTNHVLKPPPVAATFPTKLFDPATDF